MTTEMYLVEESTLLRVVESDSELLVSLQDAVEDRGSGCWRPALFALVLLAIGWAGGALWTK